MVGLHSKAGQQLDFDALILGWSMGIDPDLFQIWHSSQTGPSSSISWGYANPEADDLILKIRQEYDHRTPGGLLPPAARDHRREQPYTFCMSAAGPRLLDKRIVSGSPTSGPTDHGLPIVPTKTGGYTFHFNQWIKLNRSTILSAEG
jgi:ABC-type transport system substrate-binding protein